MRKVIEATFTLSRSKYTSKITIETLLSTILRKKLLQNLVGRGLRLS